MNSEFSAKEEYRMKRKIWVNAAVILIVILGTGFVASVQSATVYVKSGASGSNDGTSWDNAYTDLQQALSKTSGGEIWVAAGTYSPGSSSENTFQLKNNVKLYGGFGGTETALTERKPGTNSTVLSGNDINSSVVTGSGTNNTAVLDGFVITSGTGVGSGGGMFNDGGSPAVFNCAFVNNNTNGYGIGAGVYNTGSPVFTNCTFSGNSAGGMLGMGGGLYNEGGTLTLTNCTFTNNSAAGGAGIYVASGTVKIKNTILSDCVNGGGTITSSGYNLVTGGCESSFNQTGDIPGQDPGLDDLDDKGFHPLLSDSPAIDAGTCTGAPETDQRGVARPQGTTCDIGAYEYGSGPAQPVLSVTPASQNVAASGGTATFTVSNTGTGTMNWTAAVSGASWLSVTSGSSGTGSGTVTLNAQANTGAERTGTVTVTAAGATGSPKSVQVIQAAGSVTGPILSVTPASQNVAAAGETITFTVSNTGTGTMNWTAAVSGASWLTITSGSSGTGNGTVTLNAQANTGAERTGTVTVTASGASGSPQAVQVIQASATGTPVLSVSPSPQNVPGTSGTATFQVSNTGGGTLSWTAASGDTWLTITNGFSGTGNGSITVSYSANPGTSERTGSIIVTATGASGSPKMAAIVQAAGGGTTPVISVTPTSREVSAFSGKTTFDVSNAGGGTMNWTASTGDPWLIILSGESGVNSGTITVSYATNTGTAERIGSLTVISSDASPSFKLLMVRQSAPSGDMPILTSAPLVQEVSKNSGTTAFVISNSGTGTMKWTAKSDVSWLTITAGNSGTNDGAISVNYDVNTGAARTGTLTVTAEGAFGSPLSLEVKQAAGTVETPILTVDPTSRDISKSATPVSFNVSNTGKGTMNWTAKSDVTWLIITEGNSGTNAGTITVSCQANPGDLRTGTLTVTAAGATNSPMTVRVKQSGAGNSNPTDISLSNSKVAENRPAGTRVGTFTTTDLDGDDTHLYTLVSGTGGTDNDSFNIIGDELRTAKVFSYAEKNSYNIRVQTDDQRGGTFQKSFTITITFANSPPTNITLSKNSVAEKSASGIEVGTFTTTDPNPDDVHTYTLVSNEDSAFTIVGNALKTRKIFDYELKSSYVISVKSDDGNGGTFGKDFTISITDVNDDPTDISLSNSTIAEDMPAGTVVGRLTTSDQDKNDTHLYSLVSGTGDDDNDAFAVDGDQLKSARIFKYASQSTFYIRVRTTDTQGRSFEKTFTITVSTGPAVTFFPENGAEDVALDENITIMFSKAVRFLDDTEITNLTADSAVTLKMNSSIGSYVPFDATINSAKTVITLNPESDLESDKIYYVAITAALEDMSNTPVTAASATFRTADVTPPTVKSSPSNGEKDVPISKKITVTFSEPVRLLNNGELTSSNVDALITLRKDNANGEKVSFDATVSGTKTVITITPASGLDSNQTYYAAVDASLEDDSDNAISAASVTFTTVAIFEDIAADIIGVARSAAAWGDYNGDGYPDILLTGFDYDKTEGITEIYRNNEGSFSADIRLDGVYFGSVAWGDYNKDGMPDILVTGVDSRTSGSVARLYRNDDGSFSQVSGVNLPGVYHSAVAWGDYDKDGDPDILLAGYDGQASIAKVFQNNNGTFTDIEAGLTGVYYASAAWGDYDKDGDLDILLTGHDGMSRISKVYKNDNGKFTDIAADLIGVSSGSAAWGDYDRDGDLDILLTGSDKDGNKIARIYRNDNGKFTDIRANLTGVHYSSVAWGDYDNDGDPDILLTGDTGSEKISKLYRNDDGKFTDVNAGLDGVSGGSAIWEDYDKDGDPDIFLSGDDGVHKISKIYRNNLNSAGAGEGGLQDVISVLKIVAGMKGVTVETDDINGDGKIGLAEAVWLLLLLSDTM